MGEAFQDRGDEGRPAGLVVGTEASAGVGVEVLVEKHQITPVRILRQAVTPCVTGTTARIILQEQTCQSAADFIGNILQILNVPELRSADN